MNTSTSGEIGLREVATIVWRGRWLILLSTCVVTIVIGVIASILPKQYSATIVVAPASNQDAGGGVAALTSQLGSLASLAGLRGGSEGSRAETMAILQSNILTMDYIRKSNLLPVLYPDLWDARSNTWKDPKKAPTLWTANEMFKSRIRKVEETSKSSLMTMTITWTDPKLAAQWANDLVKVTNNYLRGKAVEKSERHIQYLHQQAAATDIAPLKTAIYAVLESEIKNAMLARGTDEYALKILDPAVIPEIKSSPKRTVWVIAGFLAGASVSLLIILLRAAWVGDAGARESKG